MELRAIEASIFWTAVEREAGNAPANNLAAARGSVLSQAARRGESLTAAEIEARAVDLASRL